MLKGEGSILVKNDHFSPFIYDTHFRAGCRVLFFSPGRPTPVSSPAPTPHPPPPTPQLVIHLPVLSEISSLSPPRIQREHACPDTKMMIVQSLTCRWDLSERLQSANPHAQLRQTSLSTAVSIRLCRIISFRWILTHRRGRVDVYTREREKRSKTRGRCHTLVGYEWVDGAVWGLRDTPGGSHPSSWMLVNHGLSQQSSKKKNTSHGNEVLPQDTTYLIQRPCYRRGSPCQDPAGNRTTRRPPDHRKDMQTAVVWSCHPFIRSGQNHLARHRERGKKTR